MKTTDKENERTRGNEENGGKRGKTGKTRGKGKEEELDEEIFFDLRTLQRLPSIDN